MSTAPVIVGVAAVTIADVVAVARENAPIELDSTALQAVEASRAIIEGLASDPEPHYGISTGFGALATTFIAEDRRAQLQASLVRSHAAGSGTEVEREVVRALMLLRLSTLMTGRTGVRRSTVETYAAMLNAGITPIVRRASAGAADRVPFIAVTNLARTLRALKDAGLWLTGLVGESEQDFYRVDLKGPIALVIGSEGEGLRRLTREQCDYLVRIPMRGAVESLNVSVATGITLFEVLRQRSV